MEHMPNTSHAPCIVIQGGDEYINMRTANQFAQQWLEDHPDADLIRLDGATCSAYDIEEALSPSLLNDTHAIILDHGESCDEATQRVILTYCAQWDPHDTQAPYLIIRFDAGNKGKAFINALEQAHASIESIPSLKTPQDRLQFTLRTFQEQQRQVDPQAAQQLANVLGERPGELVAMINQLCFDFPNTTITQAQVDQYLIGNPQATGFQVADQALAGHTAQAVITMRNAISQGMEPVALIGALAYNLRNLAKAAAVQAGHISAGQAKMAPWQIRKANQQLVGWTSNGLSQCIQQLAWADEQGKTNGSDPMYALEQAIELIAHKGIQPQSSH